MTLQTSPTAASPEAPVAAPTNGTASVAVPNGVPLPSPSRLPRGKRRGKLPLILFGVAALVLIGGAIVAWSLWFRGPQTRPDLVTVRLEHKDLQLKIVERGSLEAIHTYDVKCEVKPGSRGAPKIKWVVDNGTYVKEGDLLVDIDASALQEQAQQKKIDRDKAEADKIAAEQGYPQKQKAIELAMQAEQKWIKGEFPQQRHDLESKVTIAKAILQQQKDRATWVGRMVKKGYMTASQEQAEQDNLRGDDLDVQNKEEQLNVLLEFTDPYNRKDNENKVKQAKVDERTALADMKTKLAVFKEQDDQYIDLQKQIALCKIYAPHAGIVVYYLPEATRGGFGANQSIVAQGEPVQYGQTLVRIPDLTHMLVNIRVHEAFINHVKTDLPCTVRVASAPGRALKAHVKSLAAAAAPQDWMSPDVKVYQAYIEIDESVEALRLKPGLSADTTIYTEVKAEHVLAVPVQAILPPVEKGEKPHVFVLTPGGPEKRPVDLGMTDEKFIEVKSGLNEGDDIVLNPRTLLNDKEKKGGGKEDEKIVPTGGKGKQAAPGGAAPGGGAGAGGAARPKQ